jgi:tetratricopeptide (TPR) repeat protein
MDDMFQLSIEIYDTKETKIMWSDRWEEKWDNLPTIKMNLSDGLLKALDTKPKVEKKADTKYSEAYEYYLRAKYKYRKFQNLEDMEIARSLLEKAIQIDDDMISAKRLLGTTYQQVGKYSKAMEIFNNALTQSELVDNKEENGNLHLNIGSLYGDKGNLDNAQTHFNHSLKIFETLGNRSGIAYSLGNLGWSFEKQGNYELAFNHYRRSYTICEERDDKWAMGVSFSNMGSIFIKKGEFDRALEYSLQSYKTREKINDKSGLGHTLNNIGIINFYKNDYTKAIRDLNDSLIIAKQLNHPAQFTLETVVFQKLTMRKLGDKYDVNEIHSLIKESENIEFELNLRLYQLLNDKSYLETAYNQVQEKADNLEPDVKAKFLSYPIPKAIVEEWEKVK